MGVYLKREIKRNRSDIQERQNQEEQINYVERIQKEKLMREKKRKIPEN